SLCEGARAPPEMDRPDWRWNRDEEYASYPQAHLFLTRDGRSVAPQGRTFKVPWRATKLERPAADKRTKGLFLHVENVQPRRAEPEPGFPAGGEAGLRLYALGFLEGGRGCRRQPVRPRAGV